MGQAFCITQVPQDQKQYMQEGDEVPEIKKYSVDNDIHNFHVSQQIMSKNQNTKSDQNSFEMLFDEKNLEKKETPIKFKLFKDKANYPKISKDDFEIIKNLGKGSFGKVMMVRHKKNQNLYAMKSLLKSKIKNERQKTHMKTERHILEIMDMPFIVKLHFAFQTKEKLYLVCDFMSGGELFYHLKTQKNMRFNEEQIRFYAAEVLLGLEHLHKNNVIYRDLKPENILLDEDGHIKLADFGLSKQILNISQHAHSLCGTPEYLAPEIILSGKRGHDKTCDWWSFGALIYEMLCGAPPNFMDNKREMFRKNCREPIKYPSKISPELKSLLKKLLVVEPSERLGYGENDAQDIKNHEFFKDIDFDKLLKKEIKVPLDINIEGKNQYKYFDQNLVKQKAKDTPVMRGNLSTSIEHFPGFTYQRHHSPLGLDKSHNCLKLSQNNHITTGGIEYKNSHNNTSLKTPLPKIKSENNISANKTKLKSINSNNKNKKDDEYSFQQQENKQTNTFVEDKENINTMNSNICNNTPKQNQNFNSFQQNNQQQQKKLVLKKKSRSQSENTQNNNIVISINTKNILQDQQQKDLLQNIIIQEQKVFKKGQDYSSQQGNSENTTRNIQEQSSQQSSYKSSPTIQCKNKNNYFNIKINSDLKIVPQSTSKLSRKISQKNEQQQQLNSKQNNNNYKNRLLFEKNKNQKSKIDQLQENPEVLSNIYGNNTFQENKIYGEHKEQYESNNKRDDYEYLGYDEEEDKSMNNSDFIQNKENTNDLQKQLIF